MERNLVETLNAIISEELIKIKRLKPLVFFSLILSDWLFLEKAPVTLQISG